MSPADPLGLAAMIVSILDELEIRYVIGGSVAAAVWGEPRSTVDLDMMIEADPAEVLALARRLEAEFYIDADDAVDAAQTGRSFNAIHFDSSIRVDFFIAENAELAREQLARRRTLRIGEWALDFYAPEDIVIRKLIWYRLGGEHSERQWRDVLGILRISSGEMDWVYLERAARIAGVEDLLERAGEGGESRA